jgi:predicted DNA-binding transcriptional regulator AlpA
MHTEVSEQPLLVSVKEAARLLELDPRTLWRMSRAGEGPAPFHVGKPQAKRRTLRYRRAEIVDWIDTCHE